MLILAIDTSTQAGSVALYQYDKGLMVEEFINVKKNHSATIMSAIDSMFKHTELNIDDVSKVAVTIGPGSFTGIRVGVGIAKGLVYGKDREIVGVNTLDLIANSVSKTSAYIMPMIDARKGRVYYSLYRYKGDKVERVEEYKDGSIEEFLIEYKDKNIVFSGDGSWVYKELISSIIGDNGSFISRALSYPKAGILAELSQDLNGQNQFDLEPYYHSKTQAEREKEAREKIKEENK